LLVLSLSGTKTVRFHLISQITKRGHGRRRKRAIPGALRKIGENLSKDSLLNNDGWNGDIEPACYQGVA
jgi:hypothetical protein